MTSDLNPVLRSSLPSERPMPAIDGRLVEIGVRRSTPVPGGNGHRNGNGPEAHQFDADPGFSSPPLSSEQLPLAREHRTVPTPSLRARLWAIDLVVVGTSWLATGTVLGRGSTLDRLTPALAGAAMTLLAMSLVGLYQSRRCARVADELPRLVVATACGAGLSALVASRFTVAGLEIWGSAGVCISALAIARWMFGRYLRARRAQGRFMRRVLLVGANEDARELQRMLQCEPELGYVVAGVIGDDTDGRAVTGLPFGSKITDIPDLAHATGARGVLLVPSDLSGADIRHAIATAMGATLHVQVWSGLGGIGTRRVRSVPIAHEPFFYVERRTSSAWQLAAKRAIDVVGATVGLVLTAPVLGVAALLIKLDDRGPVLHVAERVGQHGQTFRIFKLRSMATNGQFPDTELVNDRTDGPLFKASKDPRVTKVGLFLRSSSMDELPQLWNVLRGTMSLVGPRPALLAEVAQFDDELQRRHSMRPGMTGLWQVEARQNPSFSAYRRLDLHYVDNWSLLLDLSIMAATVPAVFGHAIRAIRDALRKRDHEQLAGVAENPAHDRELLQQLPTGDHQAVLQSSHRITELPLPRT